MRRSGCTLDLRALTPFLTGKDLLPYDPVAFLGSEEVGHISETSEQRIDLTPTMAVEGHACRIRTMPQHARDGLANLQ